MTTHQDVRNYLLDELRKDLRGPFEADEELTDRPLTQYLTGILYPVGMTVDREQDNEANEAGDADDDVDTGTLMATAANPSAIGLTFSVPEGTVLRTKCTAAVYCEVPSATSGRSTWRRRELSIPDQIIAVSSDTGEPRTLIPGLELYLRIRTRPIAW